MGREGLGLTYAGRHRGVNGKDAHKNRLNRFWRREYSKQFSGWFSVLRESGHPAPKNFARALVVGGSLSIFFFVLAAHIAKS